MKRTTEEIISYYQTHAIGDTQKFSELSRRDLTKLLNNNNIELHSYQENIRLNNLNHGNSYAAKCSEKFDELINSIDKEEFVEFYYKNAKQATMEKYGLSKAYFDKVISYFGIEKLSLSETQSIIYQEKPRPVKNIDYEKQRQKREQTCLERYGCKSPFGSKEVREKSKQTVIDKYGVDNVWKSEEIKQKIADTKYQVYGGHGFDSPELSEKYKSTMMDRYGVEYGCLLEQCHNSTNGSNSKPNLFFEELLISNNIKYEKEYVIDSYRYDFRVDGNLIEINPSITHNSTIPYKSGKVMQSDYHINKSKKAEATGFNCICVWDWDDMNKIISLLKPRQKLYARECEIKTVDIEEEKIYLNNNHLQGYIKSKISLGLYYKDRLVALMTFGKPRYNKNYEYELLRYCSDCYVLGGEEKLFKYFKNTYNPVSIISYCDKSKFKGYVYTKLGFTGNSNYKPSKHWYNIKSGKHITDNLLRQRGFDQLFGTDFGKGTSNEELMKQNGFIEIYDCGQQTFIWHNPEVLSI